MYTNITYAINILMTVIIYNYFLCVMKIGGAIDHVDFQGLVALRLASFKVQPGSKAGAYPSGPECVVQVRPPSLRAVPGQALSGHLEALDSRMPGLGHQA